MFVLISETIYNSTLIHLFLTKSLNKVKLNPSQTNCTIKIQDINKKNNSIFPALIVRIKFVCCVTQNCIKQLNNEQLIKYKYSQVGTSIKSSNSSFVKLYMFRRDIPIRSAVHLMMGISLRIMQPKVPQINYCCICRRYLFILPYKIKRGKSHEFSFLFYIEINKFVLRRLLYLLHVVSQQFSCLFIDFILFRPHSFGFLQFQMQIPNSRSR